jgi:glycosyltransferase involved in cell wall biosynthesis
MPLKINFVLFGTGRTGGNRVLYEIANGLSRMNHDVSFVCLGSQDPRSWFNFKRNVKFIFPEKKYCFTLPRHGNLSLRFLYEKLPRKIRPYELDYQKILANEIPRDIDINVATFCFSSFAVHRSGVGIPFYYMQHYESLFFNNGYLKKMADETYYLPLNRIANSSWLKRTLLERLNVDSIGPVIPGVDTSVFSSKGINLNYKKSIVALGKPLIWKGYSDLFEALKIVKCAYPEITLTLYGNTPSMVNLSPIPCQYVVNPNDEALAKLYSEAAAVVTPSWYESSPLVPLEAMACGAPVITTRIGTEDYCIDEKNSLVVEPRRPKKLANAIIRILSDEQLSDSISKQAIATAKMLSWEKTANEVEKIFRSSINSTNL